MLNEVDFGMLSAFGLCVVAGIVLYLGAKKDWNKNDQE
jgi:hypothetical protein